MEGWVCRSFEDGGFGGSRESCRWCSLRSRVVNVDERNELTCAAFGVLWGKSKAAGRMNLLLQHLLDAAAVAELLWDRYLADSFRNRVDAACQGRGRSLFSLVCGLHDVGKATPAFQEKVPVLSARVRAVGLTWGPLLGDSRWWHHSRAGAHIVRRALPAAGWDREAVDWVWPLIDGHHGQVGMLVVAPPSEGQGRGGLWPVVQDALVDRVATELSLDLAAVAPTARPRRGTQLALAGAVIIADWIASDEKHFVGVDQLGDVSMAKARERAELSWSELKLRGGWAPRPHVRVPDLVQARFGRAARPIQEQAVALAEEMPGPGLMMVEASMGEGKTEAALAAAEVLARRFGADGVLVGMPTQATCDPMFLRVRDWAEAVEPGTPVGLLHGKRRFNRAWSESRRQVQFCGVDEYGCQEDFGAGASVTSRGEAPAEWFLGPKRGLFMPLVVATIDHLLYAATRTRHVMLRHAGLAGKVVILDEVHAYDVYMSQFLFEALRWLADAGVPVILLSATLPPAMRDDLARAYLQGALEIRDIAVASPAGTGAYPVTRALCGVDGAQWTGERSGSPWRESLPVAVEVLDEPADGAPDAVAGLVAEALRDGGCVLVVRNTVSRAQRTYAALAEVFGADVVLLHARLTAGARAERTERVLDLLGPPGRQGTSPRPKRLVVVATQLAEQSFDVDVDLLVTDLAPIDLLLQRAGRLHRHTREASARPAPVRTPRLVVTGMARRAGQAPRFPRGSVFVYSEYLLLRTAALVCEAADGDGWSIPEQVPALVSRGYSDTDTVPEPWREALETAHRVWHAEQNTRRACAEGFLLAGPDDLGEETLKGLHKRATDHDPNQDEDAVAAVVRDGPESVEVVLVRRDDKGCWTLGGRWMGVNGEAVDDADVAEAVIHATVRLPARPDITTAAKDELRPLAGWSRDPWLQRARALPLDAASAAELGDRRLTYDTALGLIDEPAR